MGRHQRRGCVGVTNSFTLQKEYHSSSLHGIDCISCGSKLSEEQIKKIKRKKFHLPADALRLPPIAAQESPSSTKGYVADDESSSPLEKTLSNHISHMQHDRKSFKDEAWYRSPIGCGSKSSVILSALKQHDIHATGFIACMDIIKTLKMPNFGFKEHEIRTLLSHYSPTLLDDSPIHISTFVRGLKMEEKEEYLPDLITQHQTYMKKIRDHATSLYHLSKKPNLQVSNSVAALQSSSNSSTRSPPSTLTYASSVQNLKLDDFSSYLQHDEGVIDLNSFECDKQRKEIRAAAKARVLHAHLNRIQEFVHHNEATKERQENFTLASKAMQHHDHLARVYEQAHFFLRHPDRCKGLINSEVTRLNRNISKDSMFY